MNIPNFKLFVLFFFLASFADCFPQHTNEKTLGSYPNANIQTFDQYKQVFNKQYVNAEHESQARENFEGTKKWLSENRDRYSHSLGFTSMSDGDMKFIPGIKLSDLNLQKTVNKFSKKMPISIRSTPTNYDLEYLMSKVTRQGCGSCWAHAAASVIEANLAKHNKLSIVVSREELIDCTITLSENLAGIDGQCNGGDPWLAWDYAKQRGIHIVKDYPMRSFYTYHKVAIWNGTTIENEDIYDAIECQTAKTSGRVYYVRDYYKPIMQSDAEIQQSIMKYGPAMVLIKVPKSYEEGDIFFGYRGGVIVNYKPDSEELNHAVVIVGWGFDKNQNVSYWKVQNSWGEDWGEKGYFRLQRGINSMGINYVPSYLL